MNRPWMPHYVAEFAGETNHLPVAAIGAYALLMGHYWTHGGLPHDEEAIRRVSRLTTWQWKRYRDDLQAMFEVEVSKKFVTWRCSRWEHLLAQVIERSQAKSARALQQHLIRRANALQLHPHLQRKKDSSYLLTRQSEPLPPQEAADEPSALRRPDQITRAEFEKLKVKP